MVVNEPRFIDGSKRTVDNLSTFIIFVLKFFNSDQMGNKGAFITLKSDLKPKFTSYEAVVSVLL